MLSSSPPLAASQHGANWYGSKKLARAIEVALSTCETEASGKRSQYRLDASAGIWEKEPDSVSADVTETEKDGLVDTDIESLDDWVKEADTSAVPV